MPFRSQAQRRYLFATHPSVAKEFAAKTPKGAKLPQHVKRKKKAKIGVDNKLKGSYGETTIQKGKPSIVKINVKKHKGNKKELADTIKHELMHVRHPKMHEKTVYKAMKKPMSDAEQNKYLAKLRMKKLNYKVGATKRKLKISRSEKLKPGDLIKRASMNRTKRAAFMGLV